jgi:FKBP-type peptidyl-prolyl cis-trans isomerase FklB
MPSDAKSSPAFHEVRPAIVPLHSFCQIFFPILRTSACERVIAWSGFGRRAISAAKTNAAQEKQRLERGRRSVLDGGRLSISVPVSAPANLTESARRTPFMKQLIVIFSASLLTLPLFGQEKSTQLKDQKDKVSYSIGLQIGFNLSRQKVDVSPDVLAAGIKDALAGKPQLNPDQIKEIMTTFEKDMEQKQKETGEKNKTEGAKFLEDNKKKEGVKTTASGLQYKVLKEGNGAQPKASDTVTVNYRGTLINGTEFDSSYKRGQPATFPVNGVIKGWTEALQLMKVGSKYQLFIPSSLAYGERAVSPDLGANSTLIFEVELLDAKPAPTPAPAGPAKAPSPAAPPSPKN